MTFNDSNKPGDSISLTSVQHLLPPGANLESLMQANGNNDSHEYKSAIRFLHDQLHKIDFSFDQMNF